MTGERIPVRVLCAQTIASISPTLGKKLGAAARHRALALLSCDCDDAAYIAMDEATKRANVELVYAKSLYAGAANATTRLAGEFIGILAAPTISEAESGLRCAVDALDEVGFRAAEPDGSVVYLAHTVSSAGSYLAKTAGVALGEPLAYLVAPPVAAVTALDAALKAAEVRLCTFFAPPTETNFAGALLTGAQSACDAACDAFAAQVCAVAGQSINLGGF